MITDKRIATVRALTKKSADAPERIAERTITFAVPANTSRDDILEAAIAGFAEAGLGFVTNLRLDP